MRRLEEITGKDIEDLKAKLLDTEEVGEADQQRLERPEQDLAVRLRDRAARSNAEDQDAEGSAQKFDFFTFEELEALVAKSAEEPDWHAAVLVAGEAGLRLGELLALEWTDIDFKNGLLTVMRNDWRGTMGAPKSGRDRKSRSRAG